MLWEHVFPCDSLPRVWLEAGVHIHTQPEAPAVHICIAAPSRKEKYFVVRV